MKTRIEKFAFYTLMAAAMITFIALIVTVISFATLESKLQKDLRQIEVEKQEALRDLTNKEQER